MNRRSRPRRKGGRRGKKSEIRVGEARWNDVMELSSELIARIEDGDEDEVTQSQIASVSRRVREAARAVRGLENAIESIRTPGAPPVDAPALRIPLGEAAMHYARSPSAQRGTLGASDGAAGSRAGVSFGGMDHQFHNFASSSTPVGGGPGARANGPQGHRVEQSAAGMMSSAPTGMMLQMPAVGRPTGGYAPQAGSTQYRLSLPPGFGAGEYGIGGPDGTSLQATPMASTEQSSGRVTIPERWDSSQGGFAKDDTSPPAQWSGRSFRSDPSPYSSMGQPAGAGGTTSRTAGSGGSGSTGRSQLPPPTDIGLEGNSLEEHAKALAGLSEKAGAGSRRIGLHQQVHLGRTSGGLLPAAPQQLGVPQKDLVGAPRLPRPSAAAAASSAEALQPSEPVDGGPIGLSSASTSHSRQELQAGAWDEGNTQRAAGLGGTEQVPKVTESGTSQTGTGGSKQVGAGESSSNTSGNLPGKPEGAPKLDGVKELG